MNIGPAIQSDALKVGDSCSLLCFVRRESRLRKKNYSNIIRFKPEETTKLNCRKRCLRSVTIPALPSMQIALCTYILKYIQSYTYMHSHFFPQVREFEILAAWHSLHKHAASFVYTSRLSANSNYQFKVFPSECFVSRYSTICVSNRKSGFCCECHTCLAEGARFVWFLSIRLLWYKTSP